MLVFALIVILIGLVAKFIMLAMEVGSWDERDHEPENFVEKELGRQLADQKFEETLQRVIVQKRESMTNPEWMTPEHMLPEEKLRRERGVWSPQMPGVVHSSDMDA